MDERHPGGIQITGLRRIKERRKREMLATVLTIISIDIYLYLFFLECNERKK